MTFINCPFLVPCQDRWTCAPLCYDKQFTNCYKNLQIRFVLCRWSLVYLYYRQGNEVGSPHKKIKKFEKRLDKLFPSLYNSNNEANTSWLTTRKQGNTMSQIEIGSQFTTQKSGVVGTVQEIVKNANGTSRVRLTVNGADRWTTVK